MMNLKKLFSLALIVLSTTSVWAAEKSTSPYTGITIEQAAGRTDLYLYNVESGLWLQENNRRKGSWNTRGELDAHGFDVAITAISGGYQINPKFGNNNSINASNFYLDTRDAVTAWNFISIDKAGVSNAYQIKSGDNWMHAMPEDNATSFGLIVNNVEARATWQIVTKEERIQYAEANAALDNPIDVTFLIKGFNLANADTRMDSWVSTQDGGNSDWNRPDDGDSGYRCLRAHGYWNSNSASYKQTITGVPDGYYEFYVTGFYRDGNREQVQERRTAGTETIRGFYFINEDRAPLKSILDGAQPSAVSGFKYAADGAPHGYFPDGGDDVARCFVDYPNAYLNTPLRATVVGGTIILGIDKPTAAANDWVFFSRFRLSYLGPIDISAYTDALAAAISDAEAYTGNTTDILQSNLDAAYAVAKNLQDTNSRDTDAISAATGALVTALNAAKAVDDTLLELTIPLAKAEGINTGAAEDFIVNGTENSVNVTLLFSLRSQRKMKANRYFDDETIASIVGSVPTDGESYYLLNVGTGMFFACNSDWGTHMALDSKGFLVKLVADGERDGYTNYHLNGSESVGWTGFNWGEEYFDKDGVSMWHFVPVAGKTNVYNLAIYDNHAWHIVYDPNNLRTDGDPYFNVLKKLNSTGYESDPNAQWILLTPAQRTALLDKATAAHPIDATHFIENPNFNKSHAGGEDKTNYGWTGAGTIGSYGRSADYVAEYFETTADLKTTLTGLPAGQYKVSVSGYYREKSFENDITVYKGGANDSDHAKLVAYTASDRVEANFMHVSVEHGKMPGVGRAWASLDGDELPFYMADAAQYFETGCYRITTDAITVGADGTLTIGVEKPNSTGNDANWIVLDNFQLICLSTDLSLDEMADNAAKINTADGLEKAKVTIARATYTNEWNTICLPFAMTETEVKATFGDEAKLAAFNNDEDGTLHFTSTTDIVAGVPYLLMPSKDVTAITATNKTISKTLAPAEKSNFTFTGIESPTAVPVGIYFVGGGNKIFENNEADAVVYGFRGYFVQTDPGAKKAVRFDVDNNETGIITPEGQVVVDGPRFNLQGQRVGKDYKGVVIVNGKKTIER